MNADKARKKADVRNTGIANNYLPKIMKSIEEKSKMGYYSVDYKLSDKDVNEKVVDILEKRIADSGYEVHKIYGGNATLFIKWESK